MDDHPILENLQRVLLMLRELHQMGSKRLRAAPAPYAPNTTGLDHLILVIRAHDKVVCTRNAVELLDR